MERFSLNKSIEIAAPAHNVWQALTTPSEFMKWGAAFCQGARMIADWRVGGVVKYLDEHRAGLRGKVVELEPESVLIVEYDSELKDGEDNPSAADWRGCRASYRLSESASGITHLLVSSEVPTKELADELGKSWDRALEGIKSLAETRIPAGMP